MSPSTSILSWRFYYIYSIKVCGCSKFVVYVCLWLFTLLLTLRLDGIITWSYWAVFLPLWFWKTLMIAGALGGSYVWWRHPQFRVEGEGYVHYKAMMSTLALQFLLMLFEILVCDKLQNHTHLWILVFTPLIFVSIISVAICIWAVKHDRSCEPGMGWLNANLGQRPTYGLLAASWIPAIVFGNRLYSALLFATMMEFFCSVNVLQFIFLALRLDGFILWNWVVVFVPLWIVMCLAIMGVLYAVIFATILLKTPEVSHEQRRTSLHSAVSYSLIVVPLLVFLVLLSNKLDSDSRLSYTAVAIPLHFTFAVLVLLSFGSKGCNHWWFGVRKDFCQFSLGICPLLQEYGNISYSLHSDEPEPLPKPPPRKAGGGCLRPECRPVVPALQIDVPD
ncbi:TMEM185A [Cordylochernes scorpioides]|uniref:TMEM185A n=1 Tax=Cordylochernes scorpioides TaxID=51811 RepID=A0ABY6JV78_9ARAC|nr:TMEM185A [Cordylochernes scorpioides]